MRRSAIINFMQLHLDEKLCKYNMNLLQNINSYNPSLFICGGSSNLINEMPDWSDLYIDFRDETVKKSRTV